MVITHKLTTKSQVTIPKEVRNQLGIKPGSRLTFSSDKNGRVYIERPPTIEELRERIGPPSGKQPLTEHERLVLSQISEK